LIRGKQQQDSGRQIDRGKKKDLVEKAEELGR
jgi:hypothetical protein